MDARVVDTYLARVAEATSVRDLHATVRALWRAHPGDPEAARVERACWDRALHLLTGLPAPPPPASSVRRDWKERAARMESVEESLDLLEPAEVG